MCVLFIQEFGSTVYREVLLAFRYFLAKISILLQIGRTEMIENCLNPEFLRKFTVDYHFEEQQKLKFEIYDVDSASSALSHHDFLGRNELNLGEIVGSPGGTIHRQLGGLPGRSCGSIIIHAEEIANTKEILYMQWKGIKLDKKDFLGKSDPFLQFYRQNNDGRYADRGV